MSNRLNTTPNDLRAFWMPFTANRQFKQNPRMLVGAKDMHLHRLRRPQDPRRHGGPVVRQRRPLPPEDHRGDPAQQAGELDYAPAFQMGHPKAFELANRLVDIAPDGMDHVLFTNSGSESVETALKVALAYHRVKGDGSRTRLIGRERGYHGVNFGGISVGGIVTNRKMFGTLLTGVDHMPHTHMPAQNAFTRGEPEHGGDIASELERIVTLHDPPPLPPSSSSRSPAPPAC
jgi:beta-alanine--pyruvate transaminase